MRTLFTHSIILVVLFAVPSFSYSETIKLRNGQAIEGKVIERTPTYIKIDFYGTKLTYGIEEIEEIEEIDAASVSPPSVVSRQRGRKSPQDIFKDARDSIVTIKTYMNDGQAPFGMQQIGLGSGFVVRQDGVIATNMHVVIGSDSISVSFADQKQYPVIGIIFYEPRLDICLLKIDRSGLKELPLGDADSLGTGAQVFVIGAPLGLEYSMTDGMLSGQRCLVYKKDLQFSAAISPGNSGGPLLDENGFVVGVVTSIALGGQNVNFALSINQVKQFVDSSRPVIPIERFADHWKEHYGVTHFAEEAAAANNQELAIRYYKEAFDVCLSKKRDCILEAVDFISSSVGLAASHIIKGNDFNKAESCSREAISLIEQMGGVEKLLSELGEKVRQSDDCLTQVRNQTFASAYYILGFSAGNRNDVNTAQQCLDKVKNITHNDEQIISLESLVAFLKEQKAK